MKTKVLKVISGAALMAIMAIGMQTTKNGEDNVSLKYVSVMAIAACEDSTTEGLACQSFIGDEHCISGGEVGSYCKK